MGRFIDLAGKRFSKWIVVKRVDVDGKNDVHWLCRCDCGNERVVLGVYIRAGKSKSCGCGRTILIEGFSREEIKVLYGIWQGMKSRCNDPKNHGYKNYGGRGIKICAEWMVFEKFAVDMGKRPGNLSIDRINNDGGYCKENCRWADAKTQANNKRKIKRPYMPRPTKRTTQA